MDVWENVMNTVTRRAATEVEPDLERGEALAIETQSGKKNEPAEEGEPSKINTTKRLGTQKNSRRKMGQQVRVREKIVRFKREPHKTRITPYIQKWIENLSELDDNPEDWMDMTEDDAEEFDEESDIDRYSRQPLAEYVVTGPTNQKRVTSRNRSQRSQTSRKPTQENPTSQTSVAFNQNSIPTKKREKHVKIQEPLIPETLLSSPQPEPSSKSAQTKKKKRILFAQRSDFIPPSYFAGTNVTPKDMAATDFDDRIQKLYGPSVISTTRTSGTVNLASLHRVHLHYLQQECVREALRFKYEKANWPLSISTGKYVAALKEYDYIKECALKGKNTDPFLVKTTKSHDRILLQEECKIWLGFAQQQQDSDTPYKDEFFISKLQEDLSHITVLPPALDEKNWNLFGGSRNIANQKEALELFLQRLGMAFVGGIFLVGPMLIMVLHQSLLTKLLTASLCVFGFGLLMAVFLERHFDVLSATAAYAAVLVVFVGTSSSNNVGLGS